MLNRFLWSCLVETIVMHIYSFEKLEVWKEAIQLAVKTYNTTDLCPNEEKFGLISQMRRCSVSVSSNIAEGTARLTKKDNAHFRPLHIVPL